MGKILPLSLAPESVPLKVVEVRVRGRGQSRRLLEIGIVPGAIIKIITKAPGPLVIEVNGARFALGWGHANRVFVEVL